LPMASFVNSGFCKQARSGCPAGVVCTAAVKETLFSEPRPLLPPGKRPPSYASSTSTRPSRRRVPSRRYIT
jgi:hypothetical protein